MLNLALYLLLQTFQRQLLTEKKNPTIDPKIIFQKCLYGKTSKKKIFLSPENLIIRPEAFCQKSKFPPECNQNYLLPYFCQYLSIGFAREIGKRDRRERRERENQLTISYLGTFFGRSFHVIFSRQSLCPQDTMKIAKIVFVVIKRHYQKYNCDDLKTILLTALQILMNRTENNPGAISIEPCANIYKN